MFPASEFPYSFEIGKVVIILRSTGRGVSVRSFWVPPEVRGQGHGSRAMRRLLRELDAMGCPVFLIVHPFGKGWTMAATRRWYERFGFVTVPGWKNKMRRPVHKKM